MKINQKMMAAAADKKYDIKLLYASAENFNEILKKVLTDEIESAIIRGESGEILNSPNYIAAHAELIGYRKALRFVTGLLNQGN